MSNDQFHEKLDALAAETYAAGSEQAIRDALETAIQYDHELHSERSAEITKALFIEPEQREWAGQVIRERLGAS